MLAGYRSPIKIPHSHRLASSGTLLRHTSTPRHRLKRAMRRAMPPASKAAELIFATHDIKRPFRPFKATPKYAAMLQAVFGFFGAYSFSSYIFLFTMIAHAIFHAEPDDDILPPFFYVALHFHANTSHLRLPPLRRRVIMITIFYAHSRCRHE